MLAPCKLVWIPHNKFISCCCHQFEFSGIICRHVFHVLSTENCFQVPVTYFPICWYYVNLPLTKPFQTLTSGERAGKVQLLPSMVSTRITESTETEELLDVYLVSRNSSGSLWCHDIAYNSQSDSLILPEVKKSDGCPRFYFCEFSQVYNLGNVEREKTTEWDRYLQEMQALSLPCCGQFGHDVTCCLVVGRDDLNGDGLGFL